MKAVLLKGHGGFEQIEYRVDVPVPAPRAGEVLIRVGAAGVNNTDINTRTGWYSRSVTEGTTVQGGASGIAAARSDDAGWTGAPPAFPRIQGADACGHIVAVGDGVNPQRMGERVLVEPVFRVADLTGQTRAVYFGSECEGAFAEFTRVPSAHAHAIACSLTDVELASFPCAYSAAENMLTRLDLQAGQTVLVTGASGGVGSAAVQLAKRRGGIVVAVAGASKAASVLALGADQVIPSDSDPLQEIGPDRIDAIVDVVGGVRFPALLEILRRGGGYAVAGAIAGPVVELDLRTLYLKDLRLLGCTVFEPAVFRHLVQYIERGEIHPVIAAVHPLAAIVEAQQEFMAKRRMGKIILVA